MNSTDNSIQDAINGMAGRISLLDELMKLAANDVIYLLIPLILALWFLPGRSQSRALRQQLAIATTLGVLLALGIGSIVAHLHSQARPFISNPGTRPLINHSSDNGFPSDHALVGFAAGGTLVSSRHLLGMAVLTAAALVGFARIFVGVHWPSDIVMGAVIGFGAGLLVARTVPWWAWLQVRAARFLPGWLLARP